MRSFVIQTTDLLATTNSPHFKFSLVCMVIYFNYFLYRLIINMYFATAHGKGFKAREEGLDVGAHGPLLGPFQEVATVFLSLTSPMVAASDSHENGDHRE